ncbi:MAG: TonB-dependent receptor plug domain-containing protein [Cyanobacteria bacterium P01_D01_bin.6]
MKQSLFGLNLLALLTVFGGQLLIATAAFSQSELETSETAAMVKDRPRRAIAPESSEPAAAPVQSELEAPEASTNQSVEASEAIEDSEDSQILSLPIPSGKASPTTSLTTNISPLASAPLSQPTTTVTDWIGQIEASRVQITDVRIEATETGVQVVLETLDGELAAPTTTVSGNALILEIANAVLTRGEFQQFDPADGIALVQVTALPEDVVQVAITGTEAVPDVDIATAATGLALTVMPGVAQVGEEDEAIQIVVTGEAGSRYFEPNTSTATRTDTPLRDIPQSIQVIPREVLEDQQITTLEGALRNVSGVVSAEQTLNGQAFIIRGFRGPAILQDGLRRNDGRLFGFAELSNVESIEVLKGPASILAGSLEPGGVINLVTEQPLSEPFYNLEFQVGNRAPL